MPIKKICGKNGCVVLVDIGTRYCEKHKQQDQTDKAERNRYYDEHVRDKEASVFYHSREWNIVRSQRLVMDNFLCIDCLLIDKRFTPADVVDHVLPLEHFPHLALDIGNLLCRCHMHHNRKTAEDKKKYGL